MLLRRVYIFLPVFFLATAAILHGQDENLDRALKGVAKADSLSSSGSLAAAKTAFDQALPIIKEKGTAESYVEAGINAAINLRKLKEWKGAKELLKELDAFSKGNSGVKPEFRGTILHQSGVLAYLEDDYDSAINFYLEAIKVRESSLGKNHPELAVSLHNLGVAYRYRGTFNKAVGALEKAALIREAQGLETKLADSYNQLGIVCEGIGDFQRSLQYHRLALDLYQKTLPEDRFIYVGNCHRDMGIVYRKMNNAGLALKEFEKAIRIYRDLFGELDPDVADGYNNLGNIHKMKSDYPSALEAYEASLNINSKLYKTTNPSLLGNYNNLGLIYHQLGENKKAEDFLRKAITEGGKYYGGRHPELAKHFENMGDVILSESRHEEALKNYQNSLIYCFAGFSDTSVYALPDLEKADLLCPKTEFLRFLTSKGKALNKYYFEKSNNEKDLLAAYSTFQLADQLISDMRREFSEEASTLALISQSIPMYEWAIRTSIALAEIKTDPGFLEKAFLFAEKSKAVVLLASLKDISAKHFSGIPDRVLDEEIDIRQEIAFLEKKLGDALRLNPANVDASIEIRNELLQKKKQYEGFITKLESDFPDYYALKYDDKLPNMEEIRGKLLDDKSLLVEYFQGDQWLFVFYLSDSDLKVSSLRLSPGFTSGLSSLLDNLFKPSADQSRKQEFIRLAGKYHAELFPIPFPGNTERLIIIPDGLLTYLPFETLLTSLPADDAGFKDLPYLLRSVSVGYGYSASTLLERQDEKLLLPEDKLMAVAPVFENSTNFSALPFSMDEVKFLKKELNTDLFVEHAATKSMFNYRAGLYDILHLSTHASAGDSLSGNAWIAFSDVGQNDYKLLLPEIYALRLKARMVVLSACETARGEFSRGEGVMSLARGFAYSGCKSIITTLWKVNNQSTSEVMKRFYRFLGEELTKDKALQMAKMDFLSDSGTDEFSAHPHFWAASIPVGDMQSLRLELKIEDYIWVMFGLIGVLVAIAVAMVRKQEASQAA